MLVMLRAATALLLLVMFPITLGASELNVMTFNIRYDNRGDGQNQWRFRADNVAKMFATHDVAVAGLQEALHHQLLELKKRLPQYDAVGVGREDGKQKGEYGPIFIAKTGWSWNGTIRFGCRRRPSDQGAKVGILRSHELRHWPGLKRRTESNAG